MDLDTGDLEGEGRGEGLLILCVMHVELSLGQPDAQVDMTSSSPI